MQSTILLRGEKSLRLALFMSVFTEVGNYKNMC